MAGRCAYCSRNGLYCDGRRPRCFHCQTINRQCIYRDIGGRPTSLDVLGGLQVVGTGLFPPVAAAPPRRTQKSGGGGGSSTKKSCERCRIKKTKCDLARPSCS